METKQNLPTFFTFLQRNHPHLWAILICQYDMAEEPKGEFTLCPITLGCLLCDMLGPHSDDITPQTIIEELSNHFDYLQSTPQGL